MNKLFYVFLTCFAFNVILVTADNANKTYDLGYNFTSDETYDKFANDCIATTGATEEDIIFLETDYVPKTRTQACFQNCFYTKIEFLNNYGTADIPKALEIIELNKVPPNGTTMEDILKKANTMLVYCNEKRQKNIADICVITRNFFECFETKGKEVGYPLVYS